MKGTNVVKVLFGRILLPLTLLTSSVLRQNIISLIYFILLLVSPLIPGPSVTFSGPFRSYLITTIVYSVLVCCGHAAFQLYLVLYSVVHHTSYSRVITDCNTIDIFQLIGYVRVDTPPAERYHAVRVILPDCLILLIAVISYVAMAKSFRRLSTISRLITTPHDSNQKSRLWNFVESSGEFLIVLILGLSGATVPSMISAVYFLIFLGVVVYWSLHLKFNRRSYTKLKYFLYLFVILNMILLYVCQLTYVQEWMNYENKMPRLFGIAPLFRSNCAKPWRIDIEEFSWPHFLNPLVLFLLFVAISLDFNYKRYYQNEDDRQADGEAGSNVRRGDSVRNSEHQLLVSRSTTNYNAVTSTPPLQTRSPHTSELSVNPPDTQSEKKERAILHTISEELIKNSYLIAFIAMLLWAVIYPSWTAFVFLIIGCIVWLFPNSRRASFLCSPLLVLYAVCLTMLQYVCSVNSGGIDYNETLIFDVSDNAMLESIGLAGGDYPIIPISAKLLFTCCFCIVLRAFRRETRLISQSSSDTGLCLSPLNKSLQAPDDQLNSEGFDNKKLSAIGRFVQKICCNYWVLGIYVLLMAMAIQEPYIYRLVYMILFLYYAITFSFSFLWWRTTLLLFLFVVALYSILAVVMVYVLSFYTVLQEFQNATNLTDDMLTDLGFDPSINYQDGTLTNGGKLLVRLIIPAILLVAVMLQIHIFQRRFMEITTPRQYVNVFVSLWPRTESFGEQTARPQINRSTSDEEPKERVGFGGALVRAVSQWSYHSNLIFISICRFCNLHMYKLVAVTIAAVVTREASALGAILLVMLIFSIFFEQDSRTRKACLLVCQFWVGIIILAKMLFQLKTVPPLQMRFNCSLDNSTGIIDIARWSGLRRLNEGESLPFYIGGYVLILVELTAMAMFGYTIHYSDKSLHESERPHVGIVFPTVKHGNFDRGLLHLFGFIINSAFFKFGLEICYSTLAVVISYRQDVFGAFYAILLGSLVIVHMFGRKHVRRIWGFYLVLLAVLVPVQYISALGLPEGLCYEYPWDNLSLLRSWLYLPDYVKPPKSQLLLGDFIVLLLISLQWKVFSHETHAEHPLVEAAGSNEDLGLKPPKDLLEMHDFMENKRNFVDVIKSVIFAHWFWFTIVILFFTGTRNINIYCLGYLVFCFYFLRTGIDFIIKPKKSLLRWMNAILMYNFLVIFCKTCLQILSCVYLSGLLKDASKNDRDNPYCILIELFSIKCLDHQYEASFKDVCGVSEDEAGLDRDIICFVVLLIQRRIFMSSYFLIAVCEERAQAKLASSGAKMIKNRLKKKLEHQKNLQDEELNEIHKKLSEIEKRTAKLADKDNWTHFDEDEDVIRSGDPSMFEEVSDEGSFDTVEESIDNEKELDAANPMKMLMTTLDSGMKSSLTAVEKSKEEQQDQQTTRLSTISEASGSQADLDEQHKSAKVEGTKDSTPDKQTEEECVEASSPDIPTEEHISDEDDETAEETVKTTDRWIKVFIVQCTKYIINKLNELSLEYRVVAMYLDRRQIRQKQIEKELILQGETTNNSNPRPFSHMLSSNTFTATVESQNDECMEPLNQRSLIYRFFNAIFMALISHTELLCYFSMVLCFMRYGSLLSIVFPVSAMLWGMLSLPRPAKTYWNAVLTYTMFLVVIKYVFQFKSWPFYCDTYTYLDPRLILGINSVDITESTDRSTCFNQDEYVFKYELVILLSVYIHRSVLKRYGLWKNEKPEEDSRQAPPANGGQDGDNINDIELQVPSDSPGPSSAVSTTESSPSPGEDQPGEDQPGEVDPADVSVVEGDEMEGEYGSKMTRRKKANHVGSILKRWYRQIMFGDVFSKGDYYNAMVLFDFIDFIILIAFFQSFGPELNGNVESFLKESRVPVPFLFMILSQFIFMIVDRILYLKKSVKGKMIFHFLLVILYHVFVFILLPILTRRRFVDNMAAQVWYFIKCIYFGLSAWQIKSGYPTGRLGNFLTTRYNYLNLFLFKGYMAIPFVLELRCIMDWMCTETSMSLGTWFLMEDIFAKIYTLKCLRAAEKNFDTRKHKLKEYPTERGKNRNNFFKYTLGGFSLTALILVLWFPLVIFSFANTIYKPTRPVDCQLTVSIGGFQDLLTLRSQASSIRQINEKEYRKFSELFKDAPRASAYIRDYSWEDIHTIKLLGESTAFWGITQPSLDELQSALKGNNTIGVSIQIAFTRDPQPGMTDTVRWKYTHNLLPQSEERKSLYRQMSNSSSTTVLKNLIPRYFYLPLNEVPGTVSQLNCKECDQEATNVIPWNGMELKSQTSNQDRWWWSVNEISNFTQELIFRDQAKNSSSDLFFVTFNKRVAPESVSIITGPGITGLYIGMVLVIGQLVRGFTGGGTYTIMFEELPNVDKIMKLCRDLYFVREHKQLKLEEDIFARLIYLYRSPQMLIDWTRKKDS